MRALAVAASLLAAAGGWLVYSTRHMPRDLAPFFPTPMAIVHEMLDLAATGPGDVVYDLGSGDGRIVIVAAEKYGARGVGVEFDPAVAQMAIDDVQKRGLGDKVQIIIGDALKTDVSPATVVTIYLLPESMPMLRPMLDTSLRPGTRVVSHNAEMPKWKAVRTETMNDGTGRMHTLYLYEIGKQY